MDGGAVVQLWTDAGIQVVVLLSFTFQVFLFLGSVGVTAIYGIGHLSVTSSLRKHRIVPFWAPLLLVHLGGTDNITAYAIEDSRLWLRHLLTLVVQTLGVSYILYNYVSSASTGALHMSASLLMFFVGVFKYGEKTWALRCGSMKGIKRRLGLTKDLDDNPVLGEVVKIILLNKKDCNEEELLILAHFLLRKCMGHFAGTYGWASDDTSYVYRLQGDDMYKLIQMQLSLMYDIMYTKAWVMHTWYGYYTRAIYLLATIITLLLFSYSDTHGYSTADVDITYFLLAGAVVLEIISVLTTIGSTWVCAGLFSFQMTPMLLNGIQFLRRRFRAASRRRWSSFIGQYNLFHVCTRDKTELGSRATQKMGLHNWWMRVHFVCTTDISRTRLPGLLLKTLPKLDPRNSKGIQILESSGLGKEQAGWSHWSLSLDFAHTILIWHIATDVYLVKSKDVGRQGDLAEAVKVLSNYMMFLLVTEPGMLPGYIEETLHDNTLLGLEILWSKSRGNTESPQNWWHMLKKLLKNDGPNGSRIAQVEEFASSWHSRFLSDSEGKWKYAPPENRKAGSTSYLGAHGPAKEHAAELLHLESTTPDLLEVIFGVWLEMLFYAAHRCGPESHASQLSRGGEFITLVWILVRHFHFPLRQ